MNVKFLSDLDYAYNPITEKYDIPMVEWDVEFYGKYWESFESEEARSNALAENEAYNNTPEVKAYIEQCDIETDKQIAYYDTLDLFECKLETLEKVELSHAISCVELSSVKPSTMFYVAKLVCQHNKQILKVKIPPKRATFTIGDLF